MNVELTLEFHLLGCSVANVEPMGELQSRQRTSDEAESLEATVAQQPGRGEERDKANIAAFDSKIAQTHVTGDSAEIMLTTNDDIHVGRGTHIIAEEVFQNIEPGKE